MNSIARALNNIAYAISNLASAITPPKVNEPKAVNTTITSNPSYEAVKVTSTAVTTTYPKHNHYSFGPKNSPVIARVTQQEKDALEAIYKALSDKGSHPDHHDHIMRELSTKWPVLHSALNKLLLARKEYYNQSTDYINKGGNPANKNIWKNK